MLFSLRWRFFPWKRIDRGQEFTREVSEVRCWAQWSPQARRRWWPTAWPVSSGGRHFNTTFFSNHLKGFGCVPAWNVAMKLDVGTSKIAAKPTSGLLSGPKLREALVLIASIFHAFHLVVTHAHSARLSTRGFSMDSLFIFINKSLLDRFNCWGMD